MVAGSACSSLSMSRASSPGGSALRVNTAELLDVGERGVAQPADVAAGIDHLVATLEHLAPGRAGMRHGAHRLAAAPNRVLGAADQLCHLGMLEVAEVPNGAREIVRTDEQHVDALDGRDALDVLDRLGRFDLADDEKLIGRRLFVLWSVDAIVRCPRRPERRAAAARRRIAASGDHGARVFGRLDVRHHHAFDAGIEHALEIVRIVRRHAHNRGAAGRRGHRLQRGQERGRPAEAMLLVQEQKVEAAEREELDHRRCAEHRPAAERALAGGEPRLQRVWAEHRPSIQFRKPMRSAVATAISLLAACATAPVSPPPAALFHDARFAPPSERISAAEVFALNDAMRSYVREHLDVRRTTGGARQALVDAVLYGDLRLDYDSAHTGTAAETFAARAGNCLSLVILTGALA